MERYFLGLFITYVLVMVYWDGRGPPPLPVWIELRDQLRVASAKLIKNAEGIRVSNPQIVRGAWNLLHIPCMDMLEDEMPPLLVIRTVTTRIHLQTFPDDAMHAYMDMWVNATQHKDEDGVVTLRLPNANMGFLRDVSDVFIKDGLWDFFDNSVNVHHGAKVERVIPPAVLQNLREKHVRF